MSLQARTFPAPQTIEASEYAILNKQYIAVARIYTVLCLGQVWDNHNSLKKIAKKKLLIKTQHWERYLRQSQLNYTITYIAFMDICSYQNNRGG